MTFRVLAIDQSSTITGVAVGDSSDDLRGGYRFGSITVPKGQETSDKLAHLFRELDAVIRKHQPVNLICYETPFMPVGRQTFSVDTISILQMAAGCVLTIAGLWKIPVVAFTPEDWRQTVIGFARAPAGLSSSQKRKFLKDAVANRLRIMGYDIKGNDESDALGILVHAMTTHRSRQAQGSLLELAQRA